MSTAPTTQAEQEDAVREAAPVRADQDAALVAELRALDDETICFDGPATYALIERAADTIASLCAGWDLFAEKLATAEEEIEVVRDDSAQQTQMLDRIAARLGLAHDEGLEDAVPFLVAIDQLAADLRKAREALNFYADPDSWAGAPWRLDFQSPGRDGHGHEVAAAALTPDPKDAGGTAKGDDHAGA
jgi:hypothetical protein